LAKAALNDFGHTAHAAELSRVTDRLTDRHHSQCYHCERCYWAYCLLVLLHMMQPNDVLYAHEIAQIITTS